MRSRVEDPFDEGEVGQRRLQGRRRKILLPNPSKSRSKSQTMPSRVITGRWLELNERSPPSFGFRKLSGKDWEIDGENTDNCHNHHDRPVTRHERFVERFDIEMGCRGLSRMLIWHGREGWNVLWWRESIDTDYECR